LKAWMSALDIEPADLEGLFDLLDTGDDLVSVEEFLMGATRVRGYAKSIDMAHLFSKLTRLERTLTELRNQVCPETPKEKVPKGPKAPKPTKKVES